MIESFHRIRKKWPGLLNKKALSSVSPVLKWVLAIWIFTAIFADQIANDLPLSCTIDGQRYFPALEESWNKFSGGSSARLKYIPLMGKMESVVMPPVPYSPQSIDRKNAGYKSPFGEQNTASTKERHWLGTDALGRDVLSGLIHGSRLALVIGFLSVFIAAFLGIVLGAFAGYYGDRRLRMGAWSAVLLLFFFAIGLYATFLALDGGMAFSHLFLLFILLIAAMTGRSLWLKTRTDRSSGKKEKRGFYIPLDLMVLRAIEIFRSLPSLFILLALIAIMGPSGIVQISLILAFLMWPSFARYTRAEFLSLREREFVSAARLQRQSDLKIIFSEILPNARAPIVVLCAFGIGSAILAEATLSFLGLGLAVDQVSWGSMLNEARKHFSAWWLAVFPGLALFIVIFTMNTLGDFLERKHSGYGLSPRGI